MGKVIIVIAMMLMSTALLAQSAKGKNKTLRHVVLIKFSDASTEQDVDLVTKEFNDLKSKITQVKSLEWGLNNSPENANDGLTHAFILTFSSEKDRDDYLVHPEHKKFVELVGKHIAKVVVVDFWVQ